MKEISSSRRVGLNLSGASQPGKLGDRIMAVIYELFTTCSGQSSVGELKKKRFVEFNTCLYRQKLVRASASPTSSS